MSEPPEPGGRIGPYRIEERLGRGGMGEVFRAFDERLQRPVALKRVRRELDESAEHRGRFLREARAAARLGHPAIVQVHDILAGEAGDWVVMEHVEGRTLAEVQAGGGLPLAEALELARQVAEGLAEAHASGIVHRDLKAENVMVTTAGRAKVLDFGLAKDLAGGSLTRTGALLGTWRSMAPEQAEAGTVDARSDLFSLGVLLYELTTGVSPFLAGSAAATLRRLVTEPHPPPRELRPELPREVVELIDHLLAKDPEHRPASAAQVAERLAWLTGVAAESGLGPPGRRAVGAGREPPGLSEAPTGEATGPATGLRPLPAAGEPISSHLPSGSPVWRRRAGWGAAAVVVLLAATLAYRHLAGPTRPLVVAVLPPAVTAENGGIAVDLTVSVVERTTLDTLATLAGVVPLAASEIGDPQSSPAEVMRRAAADETLRTTLECAPGWCRVGFRRLPAEGSVPLASAPPFEISTRPEDALTAADAVRLHLRRSYSERRPRRGISDPEVRPEDYAALLQIERRADAGEIPEPEEMVRVEALLATSPRFLEGHLWGAELARTLGDFERALGLVARAAELAPEDPRPLLVEVKIALAAGRLEQAEAALERLERLLPGDLRTMGARARVLEERGELQRAAELRRRLVELRPSWRNLERLAWLEIRLGEQKAARDHLESLLELSPGNRWGQTRLAELETVYGDPARAEALYRVLLAGGPRRSYLANLGWIALLGGRYEEAEERYREALRLEPAHRLNRLNLAIAREASGNEEEARQTYAALLAEAEGDPAGADPGELTLTALCLARLGRGGEAVAATEEALRQAPEDLQLLYRAAQVYALVGDRTTARLRAREALDRGLSPHWFHLPAFEGLRSELGVAGGESAPGP